MTKRLKRPTDPIKRGKLIGDILTGQVEGPRMRAILRDENVSPNWASWLWQDRAPLGELKAILKTMERVD